MVEKTIIINGQEYHYFDEYGTWETAIKIAKEFKKERKTKYFILQAKEKGLMKNLLPSTKFLLYLNKKLKII